MTHLQELENLIGFTPIAHERLTTLCGRDILDFSDFVDKYRTGYGYRGSAIYGDILKTHPETGKKIHDFLDKLT